MWGTRLEIGLGMLVDWPSNSQKSKIKISKRGRRPLLLLQGHEQGGFSRTITPTRLPPPERGVDPERVEGWGMPTAGDWPSSCLVRHPALPRDTTIENKKEIEQKSEGVKGVWRTATCCQWPSQPKPTTRWRLSLTPATTSSSDKRGKKPNQARLFRLGCKKGS